MLTSVVQQLREQRSRAPARMKGRLASPGGSGDKPAPKVTSARLIGRRKEPRFHCKSASSGAVEVARRSACRATRATISSAAVYFLLCAAALVRHAASSRKKKIAHRLSQHTLAALGASHREGSLLRRNWPRPAEPPSGLLIFSPRCVCRPPC